MEKRKGNVICCVVGCHNTYSNTNKSVSFYSFPSKPWEEDRKKKWISCVRRLNPDRTKWVPSRRSFICSDHFIGGKKSNNPENPAFNPTIFPEQYRKSNSTAKKTGLRRFKRLQDRKKKKIIEEEMQGNSERHETNEQDVNDKDSENQFHNDFQEIGKKVDFGCQVMNLDTVEEEDIFVFEASHDNNNVSVQAAIPRQASFQTFKKFKETESQTTDDNGIIIGFNTIKTEQQLLELGGVSFPIFQLLLHILELSPNCKLSKENSLLLFVMKMKLGITFAALSYFFNVHRTTCSRIFFRILYVLSCKTTNFIFWPSKSTVQLLLPKAFQKQYPNCRVIIDCSEIKTEEPPRADQRVFMYSSYKHSYTVKFLIGIAPHGFISYISNCYGGRTSDGYIVNSSNFLNLLEAGDEVLADKGFPHIKTDSQAITVIPPVLLNGRFSKDEVAETYNIASVRIQVERAIQRIKIYNILQKISVDLLPHVNKIVRMCAVLANMQPPIIKDKATDCKIKKRAAEGETIQTEIPDDIEMEFPTEKTSDVETKQDDEIDIVAEETSEIEIEYNVELTDDNIDLEIEENDELSQE